MENTEAKNREDVEVFNMIAEWGGWLVVAGLFAETAYAFIFRGNKPFWEAYTPVFANALVALGVLIEFKFHGWSGDRKDALTRLSEERVATANLRADEARERAATAERETEKLKADFAWRTLTAEQCETMRRSLFGSVWGKGGDVLITYLVNDPESQYFVRQIERVFLTAGWYVAIQAASYGDNIVFGIRVPTMLHMAGNESIMAGAILLALSRAEILWSGNDLPSPSERLKPVYGLRNEFARMYVGPKTPPTL